LIEFIQPKKLAKSSLHVADKAGDIIELSIQKNIWMVSSLSF